MDLNTNCKATERFDHNEAQAKAIHGHAATREHWHDLNRFMFYIPAAAIGISFDKLSMRCEETKSEVVSANMIAGFWLHTNNGNIVPYQPSQHDLFANDWMIVVKA